MGIDVHWDYQEHTPRMDMLTFVQTMLLSSLKDQLLVMSIVGTFLCYYRVIDSTSLVVLGQLSQELSRPMTSTMQRAKDALRYFAT